MNINEMTNEQLADELDTIYINGQKFPRECTPFMTMAKFIRQCVKDSMPNEEEIKKVILQWDSVIADDGLAEDMACAIHDLIIERS